MTGTGQDPSARLTRRLAVLHEQHLWAVNAAVGRGADDAVLAALSDEYADAALRALADALGPGATDGDEGAGATGHAGGTSG